jgi:hypothetical protein
MAQTALADGQWSIKRANDWWQGRSWVCGFNFLPSSAVNFLEMWHPDGFDPQTIERELKWASNIGFNAIRVNPHYLVWKHDRDGLLERFEWLLATADRLGIDTVPCLFDDCGFGGAEPVYGPQPDPVPGLHNGRAVASPGRKALMDRNQWPQFEAYFRDFIKTFKADERILFWDLYNEPGNNLIFTRGGSREDKEDFAPFSLELMRSCFDWCRSESPSQPATVGAWSTPHPGSGAEPYRTEIDRTALALSDIVTFHAYCSAEQAAEIIDYLSKFQRPMLCTEWMARAVGSSITDQLVLYHDRKVGCFQWGLTQGRTQTYLPWPADLVQMHGGAPEKGEWFHDLLTQEGVPYSELETELVRSLTSQ